MCEKGREEKGTVEKHVCVSVCVTQGKRREWDVRNDNLLRQEERRGRSPEDARVQVRQFPILESRKASAFRFKLMTHLSTWANGRIPSLNHSSVILIAGRGGFWIINGY